MELTGSRWESDVIAGRLLALSGGEGEVVWAGRAGLVRVRCLLAERLWEMSPLTGSWRWVMVGQAAGRWTATFHSGIRAPEAIRTAGTSARSALWDAVDFLRWDVEIG